MSEMKPCPFCGADNGYVDVIPNPFSNDIYSRGHCIKCHAVGTFYRQSYLEGELRPSFEQMAQMATEQWNTRPIEDELNKRIARAKELLDAEMLPYKGTRTIDLPGHYLQLQQVIDVLNGGGE